MIKLVSSPTLTVNGTTPLYLLLVQLDSRFLLFYSKLSGIIQPLRTLRRSTSIVYSSTYMFNSRPDLDING